MKVVESTTDPKSERDIYLGIDHLKPGIYQLKITLNNKIIKTVTLQRNN